MTSEPDLDTALPRCARTLVALATQWQTHLPLHPAQARAAAGAAVERFEQALTEAGAEARTVAVASYLLCVWLDEGLGMETRPATPHPPLLLEFHGEAEGGTRVFELLEHLLAEPEANRALLVLFHTALSLGLQGRWRAVDDGPRQLGAWRQRLATALKLPPEPLAPPLSARWQPARVPRQREQSRERRLLASGLLVLALASVGVYSTSQVLLARQVDAVFASLQGLEPAANVTAAGDAASRPVPDRLATRLTNPPVAGLSVRDEANQSRVVLAADTLFRPDAAQLQSGRGPLLARIGEALATVGTPRAGQVLVTAYTRADTPRPPRLPTASQLADEWAQQMARTLQPHLPTRRIVAEGRVAPGTEAARVEITIYP